MYYRGKPVNCMWQGFIDDKGKINDRCLASAVCDYLTIKGMPFRKSHEIVSRMSLWLEKHSKYFYDLSLKDYRKFSRLFEEDVYSIASIPGSMDKQNWKKLERK